MERVKGIEPSYEAWEATALPLSYTRNEIIEQRHCEERSDEAIQCHSVTTLDRRAAKWRLAMTSYYYDNYLYIRNSQILETMEQESVSPPLKGEEISPD